MTVTQGWEPVGHCPACEVESRESTCWCCATPMLPGPLTTPVRPSPDVVVATAAVERRWKISLFGRR